MVAESTRNEPPILAASLSRFVTPSIWLPVTVTEFGAALLDPVVPVEMPLTGHPPGTSTVPTATRVLLMVTRLLPSTRIPENPPPPAPPFLPSSATEQPVIITGSCQVVPALLPLVTRMPFQLFLCVPHADKVTPSE